MEEWNGVSLLWEFGAYQVQVTFMTDASGSFGCGALWQARWLQWQWAPAVGSGGNELEEASITWKELMPIVLAAAVWRPQWRELNVIVRCDNMGAVAVVNSGYSKVPQIMHLLRCLFFYPGQV